MPHIHLNITPLDRQTLQLNIGPQVKILILASAESIDAI